MICFPARFVSLAAIAVLAAVAPSRAQDFFRNSGRPRSSPGLGPVRPTEFMHRDAVLTGLDPTPAEEARRENRYNFAIGPIRFALAAGVGLEWNDNITLSEHHQESDLILRPSLDVDAMWRMSELNTLRFAMEVGYAKYFDHSEFDSEGLLFSPNSEVELKFAVDDLKFTVRERFSHEEEPDDVPQLSNVGVYRRFENQIGLTASWEINQFLNLAGGYDHYQLWTVDDEFSSQDRAVDTLFFRPTSQIAPDVALGLNAAFSFITFDTGQRRDATALFVGPLVEWRISDVTRVSAEAGVERLHFDGESTFANAFFARLDPDERALFHDADDFTGYYFRFAIASRPNDIFEHSLSASRTAEVGFSSNFYDLYRLEYHLAFKGFRNLEIGPTVFYEYYESSGNLNEEASRAGFLLGIRYHLSNAVTLGLDYRFLWKDSDFGNSSYYQNLIFVSVRYQF